MGRRLGPRGLRGQILLWSLLPTLAFLAFVAYFSFWAYSRVTEALVEDRNSELSRLLAGQMSLELGEYADRLADLRDARAATDAQVPWATVLAQSERELRDFDVGVVVLNSRGIVVAADERLEKVLRQDWSRHAYFRRLQVSPAPCCFRRRAQWPQCQPGCRRCHCHYGAARWIGGGHCRPVLGECPRLIGILPRHVTLEPARAEPAQSGG